MHKAQNESSKNKKRKRKPSIPPTSDKEPAWPDSPALESNHGEASEHEELCGPIPLTIFNKKWKNTAIIHHAEKQSRFKDLSLDRNQYTGYPYHSEWTQTFSDWTINHQEFYLTMRDVY
ncbi:hypothetical protein PCANC_19078 [Puccinia coronata f. sp. avenae]|uniref:Uncharacterized protein n=1 Tax=Puccinia coronata f. sp. avenae TaxID=200324 RepID=A0A2N5UB19_9BASI|nr:hypothetical protein PCANC_19078 [Puccinia coronata f. sp. avenae]